MYARLKPFRCQHRSRRDSAADSCDYHLTRGYPDQFLRLTPSDAQQPQHGETVTRDELIAALQQAHQPKVHVSDFHFSDCKEPVLMYRKIA